MTAMIQKTKFVASLYFTTCVFGSTMPYTIHKPRTTKLKAKSYSQSSHKPQSCLSMIKIWWNRSYWTLLDTRESMAERMIKFISTCAAISSIVTQQFFAQKILFMPTMPNGYGVNTSLQDGPPIVQRDLACSRNSSRSIPFLKIIGGTSSRLGPFLMFRGRYSNSSKS